MESKSKIKSKIKTKINIIDILIMYIIANPILDILSFIFRNQLETTYSLTTILRPIIPILIFIYIFFKKTTKKEKKYILLGGIIYATYAVIHILIYKNIITGSSFGGVTKELQYLVKYSFMILTLYIFIRVIDNKQKVNQVQKAVAISSFIMITSIYIAIITGTSSTTYIEGIGHKGWFESGNSVGAILLISMCISLPIIKIRKNLKKKDMAWNLFVSINILITSIYLIKIIGTRTGTFGCILVIGIYIIMQMILNKVSKKVISGICITGIIGVVVIISGSAMSKRQELLAQFEQNNNKENKQKVYVTGSIFKLREEILNKTMSKEYMSDIQQNSIIAFCNKAEKLNINSTDQRMQALIYNIELVKEQKNILTIFLGNGFNANFCELVLEMECIAILLNFGIIGFILFVIPYLVIITKSVIIGIKNMKKLDIEYIMNIAGLSLTIGLAVMSGYIFINISITTLLGIMSVVASIKNKELKGLN